MVKQRQLLCCFFLLLILPQLSFAKDGATVSVLLDSNKVAADSRLTGVITIKHPAKEKVEKESFQLKEKPLAVTLLKNVEGELDMQVSTYSFSLAVQGEGLQVLPPISLIVGGKQYATSSQTYEVIAAVAAELQIEAFVVGSKRLYIGEERQFGYRYIYSKPVELTQEHLPLLEPEGFKKIGTIQVNQQLQGPYRVTLMTQRVKAEEAGNYSFGPSIVEGYAYTVSNGGKRIYNSSPLQATAPAVDIVVIPFPEAGKPAAFNGAIGRDMTFKVELLSYPEMRVGDKMTLSLTIGGDGDLEGAPMPELCCQPGFPGNFKLGDIPPAASMYDGNKVFIAELRPLSPSIKEIPAIYFSYYDPEKNSYSTLKTAPIPITVLAAPKPLESATERVGRPESAQQSTWPESTAAKSDHHQFTINVQDLFDHYLTKWVIFFLIPFGAGVVVITYMKKRGENLGKGVNKKQEREEENTLQHAFLNENDPTRFYQLLNHAFLEKLKSSGLIETSHIAPQQLKKEGLVGEVREFLCTIEESRFTGREKIDFSRVKREAEELYKKIEETRG